MSRRLLLVAYHFPPIQGSSGVHRTLAFARYLQDFNWSTTILTVTPGAYTQSRTENEDLVPTSIDVVRAPAVDSVRHLSIGGRYFRWTALPDRWQSWIPSGILKGLMIVRRQRPAAILSTFPIASAHAIGLALSRITGIPWIADFRDPMDQITYPSDPLVRRCYRWIEQQAFYHATRILVTTPGTASYYRARYGETLGDKIRVIPNGFDPEAFPEGFVGPVAQPPPAGDRVLTLLHSGILYPFERDPEPFLRAVAKLRRSGDERYSRIRVVFRGSAHETHFAQLISELELTDSVSFPSALPYQQAIQEMLTADALLVFQADNCNSQIPAKAYEYLYSGRPIIGITDPKGDTGQLLHRMGLASIAKLEDENAIERVLRDSIDCLRLGTFPAPDRSAIMTLSRKARTAELADVLEELSAGAGTPVRGAHTAG